MHMIDPKERATAGFVITARICVQCSAERAATALAIDPGQGLWECLWAALARRQLSDATWTAESKGGARVLAPTQHAASWELRTPEPVGLLSPVRKQTPCHASKHTASKRNPRSRGDARVQLACRQRERSSGGGARVARSRRDGCKNPQRLAQAAVVIGSDCNPRLVGHETTPLETEWGFAICTNCHWQPTRPPGSIHVPCDGYH